MYWRFANRMPRWKSHYTFSHLACLLQQSAERFTPQPYITARDAPYRPLAQLPAVCILIVITQRSAYSSLRLYRHGDDARPRSLTSVSAEGARRAWRYLADAMHTPPTERETI